MRRFFPTWLLLPILLLYGCSPSTDDEGVSVELVSLDLAADAAYVPVLDGPVRLLSVAPSGEMQSLRAQQTVNVTFSRPMVPLGETPQVPEGTLTLNPAVEGTYRWSGTQTLVFQPSSPLPPATAYTATLAPTLADLDGNTLDEPHTWTFETPRPRLIASTPSSGESYADPGQNLRLDFNLPVTPSEVAPYLALSTPNSDIPFDVVAASDSSVLVQPRTNLPSGTDHTLTLREGLPTTAGPLGMGETTTVSFSTYGPLALREVTQPYNYWEDPPELLDPERGISLSFNNPVRFEDLRTAIRFDPPVEMPPGIEARDGSVSTEHALPVTLQPETRYTVTLDSLRDTFGQLLPMAQRNFRTRAFASRFRMSRGLLVIEADQTTALPISVVNIGRVQVGMERLGLDDLVPAMRAYDTEHYYGEIPEGTPQHETVSAIRDVAVDVPRNTPDTFLLRMNEQLRDSTGVVGMTVTVPEQAGWQNSRTYEALAQVTRLGLTTKFSPHQNLVFVTTLADATPVSGANVQVRDLQNRVLWTGTTDASGRARTPGWAALGLEQPDPWSAPVQFVLVEYNGDIAFTASIFTDGLEPYRFEIPYAWKPEALTYAGSIFTDRGLYRAGDTVHLKAILKQRTDADWRPITDSVRVLIESPRDELVHNEVLLPNTLGSVHWAWRTSNDEALGNYRIRIADAEDETATTRAYWEDGDLARGSFRVDAFRTATFNVEARSALPQYTAGDFFEGTLSGRYLFGAPMQDQSYRYTVRRDRAFYAPPGLPGYRFAALNRYGYESGLYLTMASEEGTLNDEGVTQVRTQIPGNAQGSPMQIVFEGTVTDPARQEQSGRTSVTVHPGLYYIGLKATTTFLDLSRSNEMAVDVIAVSPEGAAVESQTLDVSVIRQQWNSVREIGVDGRFRWRSERTEEPILKRSVTTQPRQASRLSFRVPEGGSYIIRAEGRDLRGNLIRSESYFYATGSGYVAWERRDDDRIELIANRNSYQPGETARVMVQSPYEEAQALITIERDGILSSRVETLTGSAPQIEIPLTEAHLPNVFVSVVLLTGRTAAPSSLADTGAPGFKMGYVELTVDPGVRHLRVDLTPDRPQYQPGDEVTVQLRLRNAAGDGVPGEIAFSAADAGVLNLIGYQLPDPFGTFYGSRPLRVNTTESRANLIKQRNYGQKEEDSGGGGGDDADRMMRTDFRPLAHWDPILRTDARGRATVRFRLPESLTTFRLMANAHTQGNLFGAVATDIVVTKPLVMQPALPRFARLDDRFEAGVLVTNTTGADGEVVVTASAEGLTLAGEASQRVPLADGATKEVYFPWQVESVEDATLTFTATLGSEEDGLVTPLPISLPTSKQASATFASTSDGATESLRVPQDRIPGLGRFQAQVASTALVGLDGASRYLFEYPYGCLEQRTSRIRPLLLADDLLDKFDLEALGGQRSAVIAEWIELLNQYWTGDGFSLWPGSNTVNPYVSAYVVLAIAEAEAAGFDVPDALTQDAVTGLARSARRASDRPNYYNERVWRSTRAFQFYALARHNRLFADEVATLAEASLADGQSSVETLSYLLRTAVAANDPLLNRFIAPLRERLQQNVRVEATTAYFEAPEDDNYQWIFASDVRATAFGLSALIEATPSADTRQLAQRMVRYLMQTRQRGAWASTQENAAVIDAFRAYAEAFEQETPDFTAEVLLAGEAILATSFEGRSLTVANVNVPLDELSSEAATEVSINKDGSGLLYYSLLLETYSQAPQQATDRGLRVSRTYERLDQRGQPIGAPFTASTGTLTVGAGDMVRITLRLTSPTDRHYVVVDDALPAGFEPLNTAFLTTNQEITQDTGSDRWWGSFNHTEMRDDRVLLFADYLQRGEHTYTYVARATTPGTFVYPPVQSELMYQPEVRGQSATTKLVVERPASGQAQR